MRPRAFATSKVMAASTLTSFVQRRMMHGEILVLVYDTFRANRIRFFFTALGMVVGTASLILVVAIGLTGKQYAVNQIRSIGANMIDVEYQGGGEEANP